MMSVSCEVSYILGQLGGGSRGQSLNFVGSLVRHVHYMMVLYIMSRECRGGGSNARSTVKRSEHHNNYFTQAHIVSRGVG